MSSQTTVQMSPAVSLIKDMIKRDLAQADAVIEKFKIAFAENPYHALCWSFDVYSAVARKEMLEYYSDLPDNMDVAELQKSLQDRLTRTAMEIPSSSSVGSNTLDNHNRVALGQLFKEITRIVALTQ